MANEEQAKTLKQGVKVWNAWREQYPDVKIDLTEVVVTDSNLRDANLSNADLRLADLRGADLSNADLRGADLRDMDFSGANLRGTQIDHPTPQMDNKWLLVWEILNLSFGYGIDLAGADLSNANLRGESLEGANLTGANLTGVDLTSANLADANLSNANLTDANLTDVDLTDVDLRDLDLTGANLTGVNLLGPVINETTQIDNKWRLAWEILNYRYGPGQEIPDINLADEDLTGANLTGANLTGVNMEGANLTDVNLNDADLSAAKLAGANLTAANLVGVDLRGADLSDTNLRGADLTNANLSSANLTGTNLTGANLRATRLLFTNFSNTTLTGSCLYGTARDDWIISNIHCDYVFWDAESKNRTPKDRHFKPREFEEIYQQLPSFAYVFEHGFTALDAVIMARIVEAINEDHPEFELKLDSFQSRGQPHATFTVVHKEYLGQAQIDIKNKYESNIQALQGQMKEFQEVLNKVADQPKVILNQLNAIKADTNFLVRNFQDLQIAVDSLREQLHRQLITEEEFFVTISQKIEAGLHNVDFQETQTRLIQEFPYLRQLLTDNAEQFKKYRHFLLTAEYLYQERLSKGIMFDSAVIIIEYAKIIDAILQEYVGRHIRGRNYSLGSWAHTLPNSQYQSAIASNYATDQNLIHFLTSELSSHTEHIRRLRNSSAHSEAHGLAEAKQIREYLLTKSGDSQKTLMKWCLQILYY